MDNSKTTIDIFNKYANLYQDKFMDTSLYHDTFDLFCASIKKDDAAILELACGPGNITKYLLDKKPGLKILGTDLAPNMIALAALNNPSATFQLMDCREIGSINKKYDGIMCGFCLPYLSKEEVMQLLNNAAALLNPGGIIYISTMEDSYSNSGLKKNSQGDEMYMYYYEAAYLTHCLKENNFKILDLQRIHYHAPDGANITDLVMIATI